MADIGVFRISVKSASLDTVWEAVNLKAWSWVDGVISAGLRAALPSRCLLCAAAGTERRDLCAACAADLKRNTICCERCALPLEYPAAQCGSCLQREPPFASSWAPFVYAHPLDLLEARFKFRADLAAGRVLAELMIESARTHFAMNNSISSATGVSGLSKVRLPDLLLCVPLHHKRLRERGYNQALELARPLAKALSIPFAAEALQRTRHTDAQTGLDAKARRRNLRGAFALQPNLVLPPHVAIIDDVMTTGTTLRECAQLLQRAGVIRVDVWALARAPARS